MEQEQLLFVYGTLRAEARCAWGRWLAGQATLLGSGVIPGRLYDVGSYPALSPALRDGEYVRGDLYRLSRPRHALSKLDRYEGIGSGQSRPYQYRRERVLVTADGQDKPLAAWVYRYVRPLSGLKLIAGGDYLAYLQRRRGRSGLL